VEISGKDEMARNLDKAIVESTKLLCEVYDDIEKMLLTVDAKMEGGEIGKKDISQLGGNQFFWGRCSSLKRPDGWWLTPYGIRVYSVHGKGRDKDLTRGIHAFFATYLGGERGQKAVAMYGVLSTKKAANISDLDVLLVDRPAFLQVEKTGDSCEHEELIGKSSRFISNIWYRVRPLSEVRSELVVTRMCKLIMKDYSLKLA